MAPHEIFRLEILFCQTADLVLSLVIWEWSYDLRRIAALKPFVPRILDPCFISKPSMIRASFLKLGCFSDKAGFSACFAGDENNFWFEDHNSYAHRSPIRTSGPG